LPGFGGDPASLPQLREDGIQIALLVDVDRARRQRRLIESLDVEALVALMTDDAWVRMPPLPLEYRGTAAAHRFFAATDVHRRGIARMVPVRANSQLTWASISVTRLPVACISWASS
jgi:hypothetical protein